MSLKFPRPSGSKTPIPTKKEAFVCYVCNIYFQFEQDLLDHMLTHAHDIEPKEKKQREPKHNKERDLLIETKAILDQIKDYHCFQPLVRKNGTVLNRTTGPRIKELLKKIEEIL